MREGMLHIRDVEGPKKTGSMEMRIESMEQQVFKCQGMVERGLNANHMMITEFTNKHRIDANDIGKHLSRLYDRIDQLIAQIYDLQNQNYEYEYRLKSVRRDFLEKFRVLLDASITFQCTIMKMMTIEHFNCLVTNESNCTYFDCPDWTALASAYQMEDGERAMFYLDYDHEEIMVYYRAAGSDDDGPLTPDYDPDSACQNVELAS
ncbi:hypothetical protein D1007_05461 [Hordeum vulgare]|nr:hypothetical protein D1007_05461 [Hordeum vulgare]